MSWIQDNKFLVALGGGTLVGAAVIIFLGLQGSSKFEQAQMDYEAAFGEASGFVKGPLYPKDQNRDGKKKALDEYRAATESLQAAFGPYRPKEIKNSTPQEFTSSLIAANEEVRKAFENSETKLPEAFFLGFESYKSSLARSNSTGILSYQLGGIKDIMLALAKSGASELKNVHRPPLEEEDGREFKPADTAVARPLPVEITFLAPEKSVREFLSSVVKAEGKYVVIRSIRVASAKKDPPRAADAKFEKPAAAAPVGGDAFGGFVLPGEEPKTDAAAPAAGAEATPAPAPAGDSSRILAQVLGNEELQVFVRLDFMQFLPAKKLP